MLARVSTMDGGDQDASIEHLTASIVPELQATDGFRGIIALVDRAGGRSLGITLWASEAALAASEQRTDRLRERAAAAGGERISGVDRYEVVLLELEPS